MTANYKISVVVPTYNRLDRLQRVLTALEAQTVPVDSFEVVVVSDGSKDGTNDFLKTVQTPLCLVPVLQENTGVAGARNAGVARATSDLVLFVDDDVVPTPTLIADHLRRHELAGENAVILGPMLTPPDFTLSPWVLWEQTMLEKQYRAMEEGKWLATARQFYTGNTSLARHHILEAGGFDLQFRRAEDIELGFRLAERGLTFVYAGEAVGHHYAERSFESWLTTPYLYGRNDVVFTEEKGQKWLLPTVFFEFRRRHLLIRGLTRLCLDREELSKRMIGLMRRIADVGARLGIAQLPRLAYSGIFNLRQYQGVSDGIGGRAEFFAGVKRTVSRPGVVGEV